MALPEPVPAQAVAISTQSSLVSLPAMLKGVNALGVPPATADLVMPVAVAIFRATGPSMNLAVAIYVAHWMGIELTPWALAAGVAAAATTTIGAVSLPGTVSFVTSIAPISIAMGVPVEPRGRRAVVDVLAVSRVTVILRGRVVKLPRQHGESESR